MHHRLSPKPHRFHYRVFMFYVDLDELELIRKKIMLVGLNRFNVFSFRNRDHIRHPDDSPPCSRSTKEHLLAWLADRNIMLQDPRIMLLTNFCTFGYQFNPVSFYYIFDSGRPVCAVAEVSNTFGEMKAYLLGPDCLQDGAFRLRTRKHFYVSPFIDHDAEFEFVLPVPGPELNIRIDDHKDGERFFISTLTGSLKELSNGRLFLYALRFPFITLKVISLIHWNAFRLWMKGLKYHRKKDHAELQRGMFRR